MKPAPPRMFLITIAIIAAGLAALIVGAQHPQTNSPTPTPEEKAVSVRMDEIRTAAESLDVEKVFSFVLENDAGSMIQNGRLQRTRAEALEFTRQGFQSLKKVEYHFSQQYVKLLSPTIALAVGEGTSSATTGDGEVFTRQFAQTVVMVLTNGEWKVLHAHRSFPQ